mmetsp:Transcript_52/g.204  ORF Transcript_52/g.204 Transcript_52/m.204 type:complete len:81 (-) Transcript_52:40-282(-)|eukprot:588025-Prymnesium_polylepis.1
MLIADALSAAGSTVVCTPSGSALGKGLPGALAIDYVAELWLSDCPACPGADVRSMSGPSVRLSGAVCAPCLLNRSFAPPG